MHKNKAEETLNPLPSLARHILFIRRRFLSAVLTLGFSGMVAQVLLLREILVIFQGNELTIGIVLGNWLVLEAIGSFFLGKKIEKIKLKIEAFVAVQLLVSVFLFPLNDLPYPNFQRSAGNRRWRRFGSFAYFILFFDHTLASQPSSRNSLHLCLQNIF